MQKKRKLWLLMALSAIIMFLSASCGGGGGGGGGNNTPVARAGSDQNVMVESTVTLDASGSTGLVSSITWTFTSKPEGSAAELSSPTAIKPTFTADLSGSYVLSLRIGNGTVTSSPDTVTIKAVKPRAVPDTGQTTFYVAGDDSTYSSNTPSFTDNLNGTITDHITGLMWQKCTIGLNPLNCSGTSLTGYNWYQATGTYDLNSNPSSTSACGIISLGSHTDWRLPTDFELLTIADHGKYSMAIDSTYFPATSLAFYWSSTPLVIGSASSMEFYDGQVLAANKDDSTKIVRCVRGEQSAPVLTDNGDGTITDNVTGLMWQKQDDGFIWSWTAALSYCENLTLPNSGHTDWRVPNVKELRSIVDMTKYQPAVNTVYFPATKTSRYWSATTVSSLTSNAWTVSFNSGSVGKTVKISTTGNYVRCVRSVP